MKTWFSSRPRATFFQRGIAAIELAIALPVLISMLTLTLFYARYFWYYSVAQKAAQDSARFMVSARNTEMKSLALATAMSNAAREIVAQEMADLPLDAPPVVDVQCDTLTCNGIVPNKVRAHVFFRIKDNIFGAVDAGDDGLTIDAEANFHYVGN